MMKKIFLFCLILLNIELNAQLNVTTEADISDYPYVEFSFNNKNPKDISSSFIFSDFNEGDKTVIDDFEVDLIEDTTDYSEKNKCVIILLEKNFHLKKTEQVITFYTALKESLSEFVNDGDLIKIVDFSWRDRNKNNGKILNDINNDFTDKVSVLDNELERMKQEVITNPRKVMTIYNTKSTSDIYSAIDEAISQLDEVDTKLPKSILVLSEEVQNKNSSGPSSTDVIKIAKEKNILINTIKYHAVGFGQHSLASLSKETYGTGIKLTTSSGKRLEEEKKNEAKKAIIDILNNVIERSAGKNYHVRLKLNNDIKDGTSREIIVELDGSIEKATIEFNAQGNWLIAFFQKNLYIALGCCVLLLLLIVIGIIMIVKNRKKKRQQSHQRLQRQRQTEQEQESEILKQKNELQSLKDREEQRKKQNQLKKDEELRVQDEQKLLDQMKNMGQLPILKYSSEGETLEFTIDNPNLTVGRDAKTNRLCVPNNHISRNHFRITFSGGSYTIYDNKSANGIIVNGRKVDKSVLKNGDVIQVANATFTFIK